MILYATSPIQRVVGFARVTSIVEGSLESLWSQYGSVGGVTRGEFDAYFKGLQEGSVLVLSEAKTLKKPLMATHVIGDGAPPQSFMYVSTDLVHTLVHE